jgi:hypothetical protein
MQALRAHARHRPGQASEVLTKHYEKMHPDAFADAAGGPG